MKEHFENSILIQRQSKRAYLDTPIPDEVLARVIEKTRWAPSCANNQPWRFVIVREASALARTREGLNRGNAWAKKAPVLVVLAARQPDSLTRKDDPAVQYYLFDCGLAVENLLLAAVEEGLMGHPMAGYQTDAMRAALNIPDDYHVLCVISLGYAGSIDDLDAETRAKDEKLRIRKDVGETFFWDGWPAPD